MVNVNLDCPKTSMAISCMWGWMIPHFYIEFSEFRLALERVAVTTELWEDDGDDDEKDETNTDHDNNNNTNTNNNSKKKKKNTSSSSSPPPPSRKDANMATVRGVCAAIVIMTCIYAGSAFVICRLTQQYQYASIDAFMMEEQADTTITTYAATATTTLQEQHKDEHEFDDNNNNNNNTTTATTFINTITTQSQLPLLLPIQEDEEEEDPPVTKMHAIIIGIGRMLSACLLAYFSIELPRWLGVTYSSQKHVDYYKQIIVREEEVEDEDDGNNNNNNNVNTKEVNNNNNNEIEIDSEHNDSIAIDSDSMDDLSYEEGVKKHNTTTSPPNTTTRMVVVGMKELTFRVCWSILGHFFIMYPFLMLYCCNVTLRTILASTVIGVGFGFWLVYCLWLSHTKLRHGPRSVLAIILSFCIAVSSSAAFAAGCWYVKEVWHNNTAHTNQLAALTFFLWFVLIGTTHFVYYRLTQRKLVETAIANGVVTGNRNNNNNNININNSTTTDQQHRHHQHQQSSVRRHHVRRNYNDDDNDSISFSVNRYQNVTMNRDEVQKIKDEWRYGQSTFQPPKSVNCVANELSQVVSPAKIKKSFVSASSSLMKKKKKMKTKTTGENSRSHDGDDANNNNDNDDDDAVAPTNLNFNPDFDDDLSTKKYDDGSVHEEQRTDNRDAAATAAIAISNGSTTNNRPRNDSTDATFTTYATVESYTIRNSDTNDDDDDDDDDDEELQHTAITSATATATVGTNDLVPDGCLNVSEYTEKYYSNDTDAIVNANANATDLNEDYELDAVPSDVDIIIHHDDMRDDDKKNPTLWYMMKVNSCCRRRRHYDAPRREGCDRFSMIFKWSLWTMAASMHIFLTILTIGATIQQNTVREALNPTFELLYPPDYNSGKMCAWKKIPTYNSNTEDDTKNDNTIVVDYSQSDIRTFDSLQDVHDANYTVIHCGECGHCSNYNDLSLQWTTRTYLAESARECGTQILFGGTFEDVHDCNENEIGFTEECAMCWTVDEMCCKSNCFFIFLQSVFTNSLSNFQVDRNAEITTAACDEALCGPEFVPCSGATRRRMNIVSDIARPATQQCNVVTEDWSAVFDHYDD